MSEVVWVRLGDLTPAPWNINEMGEEEFVALMGDMGGPNGPYRINPIRVRPVRGGKYQIVDGHQRFEAARRLGWAEIRAVVVECSELEARILNFRFNFERGRVNPVREAEFYRFLLDKGWSLREIERKLNVKRQRVQQILRRLKVAGRTAEILETPPRPEHIEEHPRLARWKGVSPSHYEAVGRIENQKLQEEIAKLTVEHGLSAKETHTLVDHVKKGLPPQKALTLIIESGKAQPKTATFTCEKCGTTYLINWSEQKITKKIT